MNLRTFGGNKLSNNKNYIFRLTLKLLVISFFTGWSAFAMADEINFAVLDVANARMAMSININGEDTQVVYVGETNKCSAVSIIWPTSSIHNYRVCSQHVTPRDTLSPAWEVNDGKPTFDSVLKNAVMRGRAQQKDINGYLISMQLLNSLNLGCKNIETIVSYDFDLVDWNLHEMCGMDR